MVRSATLNKRMTTLYIFATNAEEVLPKVEASCDLRWNSVEKRLDLKVESTLMSQRCFNVVSTLLQRCFNVDMQRWFNVETSTLIQFSYPTYFQHCFNVKMQCCFNVYLTLSACWAATERNTFTEWRNLPLFKHDMPPSKSICNRFHDFVHVLVK